MGDLTSLSIRARLIRSMRSHRKRWIHSPIVSVLHGREYKDQMKCFQETTNVPITSKVINEKDIWEINVVSIDDKCFKITARKVSDLKHSTRHQVVCRSS